MTTRRRKTGRRALGLIGGVALAFSFAAVPALAEGPEDGNEPDATIEVVDAGAATEDTEVIEPDAVSADIEETVTQETDGDTEVAAVVETQWATEDSEVAATEDVAAQDNTESLTETDVEQPATPTTTGGLASPAGRTGAGEGWGTYKVILTVADAQNLTLDEVDGSYEATGSVDVTLRTTMGLAPGESIEIPVKTHLECPGPLVEPADASTPFKLTDGAPSETLPVGFTLKVDENLAEPQHCDFKAMVYDSVLMQQIVQETSFLVYPQSDVVPTVDVDSLTQSPAKAVNECPATTADLAVSGEVRDVTDDGWQLLVQLEYGYDGGVVDASTEPLGEGGKFSSDLSVDLEGTFLSKYKVTLQVQDADGNAVGDPVDYWPELDYVPCEAPIAATAQFDPPVVALSSTREGGTVTSTLRGTITVPEGTEIPDSFGYSVPGAAEGSELGPLDDLVFSEEDHGTASFAVPIEFDEAETFTASVFAAGEGQGSDALVSGYGTQAKIPPGEFVPLATADITVRDGMISAEFTQSTVQNTCPAKTATATASGKVYSAEGLSLYANLWAADPELQGQMALQHKPVKFAADGSFTVTFDGLEAGEHYVHFFLVDEARQRIDNLNVPLDVVISDCSTDGGEKPAPEKPAPEKPAPVKPAPEKPAPEKPAPVKPAQEKPAGEELAKTGADAAGMAAVGLTSLVAGALLMLASARRKARR